MDKVKTKVWIMCEAFCLTCDHMPLHQYMRPSAIPFKDRSSCMRQLRKEILGRISEYYEGSDNYADAVSDDFREVMATRSRLRPGMWMYYYSAQDREIVWIVYRTEVRS